MMLVIFSIILNHHQAPVADELYQLLGDEYRFVELTKQGDSKGATEDFSKRPYLMKAWESVEVWNRAMELAKTAECCVFGGVEALPFAKERMRLGLLSFDMGERWLKHGWKSLASPRLLKWHVNYHLRGWKHKPLYKLCCSAYCASDHSKLGAFKGKCYKWGYFTSVASYDNDSLCYDNDDLSFNKPVRLMWCSRYLMLKHPELPILLVERLRERGYSVHLDMYGDGECRKASELIAERLGLRVCKYSESLTSNLNSLTYDITFHGNVPNEEIRKAMREHDIFLFTSDRYEGWGAVANESMSEGCVLVASDCIGSSPYLIKDGENGFTFRGSRTSCSFDNPDMDALDSLYERVSWLLDHPKEMKMMQKNAMVSMQVVWSPENAAKALLRLIEDLKNGKDTSIEEGPCSKA